MTDLDTSKLIQGNVALCEKTEAVTTDKPKEPPTPTVAPAPTRTIVRIERRTDYLAMSAFGVGLVGLGGGAGLFVASGATRDAAASAHTLDENHALNDKADRERGMSYAALGLGAGLVGFAIYRWVTASDETPPATVALGHSHDATTFSLITRF
jgi:hypothetical protein